MADVSNDFYVTVTEENSISVVVGDGNTIAVTATSVGPAGTGYGMLLTDYAVQAQLPNWSGAVSVNLDLGNVVQPTLQGDVTSVSITGWPSAGTEGKLVLYIPQGATPYTITGWPAGVKWLGAQPPQLTNTTGNVDIIVLTSIDGGTTILGFHIGVAS